MLVASGADRVLDEYDFIVVGSGFTALAFISETLRLNSTARILCLERGGEDVRGHHLRLLAAAGHEDGDAVDVDPSDCPWQLSEQTAASAHLNACAGACYLLGGRSNYWYGWCVEPVVARMRDYPRSMRAAAARPAFWERARELLGVRTVDRYQASDPALQQAIDGALDMAVRDTSSLVGVSAAFFAHADESVATFARYATGHRLLKLAQAGSAQEARRPQLDIQSGCAITRLCCSGNDGHVDILETEGEAGRLIVPNRGCKVVLCCGAIPNASILLNSFTALKNVIGRRVGGHFRSHVFARVARSAFASASLREGRRHAMAAKVLCGRDEHSGLQFHIQLSAFCCPQRECTYSDLVPECPRYGTAPVKEQLEGLEDDVLISCATLGELDERNPNSWLRWNNTQNGRRPTLELQFEAAPHDLRLWDVMDEATFVAIESLASDLRHIQYWSKDIGNWRASRPSAAERRSKTLVHEACVTPVGSATEGGVVDDTFKVYGCANVFVTGAGILPTAGSSNPTLTICGYAQQLARNLQHESAIP